MGRHQPPPSHASHSDWFSKEDRVCEWSQLVACCLQMDAAGSRGQPGPLVNGASPVGGEQAGDDSLFPSPIIAEAEMEGKLTINRPLSSSKNIQDWSKNGSKGKLTLCKASEWAVNPDQRQHQGRVRPCTDLVLGQSLGAAGRAGWGSGPAAPALPPPLPGENPGRCQRPGTPGPRPHEGPQCERPRPARPAALGGKAVCSTRRNAGPALRRGRLVDCTATGGHKLRPSGHGGCRREKRGGLRPQARPPARGWSSQGSRLRGRLKAAADAGRRAEARTSHGKLQRGGGFCLTVVLVIHLWRLKSALNIMQCSQI
uniref:uncharacterized protein LOC118144492 n=1 Tax=Callithrix jacchus TaxID=9483 RepID=UPI0023DD1B0F|nr:uncharacterized protein LOC118144492 [Callithrix jacchus]